MRIQEDTPLSTNITAPGSVFCVDTDYHNSVCTFDPFVVLSSFTPPSSMQEIDLGLEQRVDGTEAEQAGIRTVLRLMNLYWFEEVLSNIDYEDVRSSWCVT